MTRKIIGVVTRQLWDNPVVPSTVIAIPVNVAHLLTQEGEQKAYIRQEAEAHKNLFTRTMREFSAAQWTLHFMEVYDAHGAMLPSNLGAEPLK